jgi:hypothetical protein
MRGQIYLTITKSHDILGALMHFTKRQFLQLFESSYCRDEYKALFPTSRTQRNLGGVAKTEVRYADCNLNQF